MAYIPKVKENVVYVDKNGTKYKVESITNDGVNVLKLKSDGSVDKTIYWTENKWNSKGLVIDGEVTPPENNNTTDYTFSFDENGILTISHKGKVIQKFDIRGPEGKPGANGMPGQNGAPGQKGQDGAPGQPGQDGAPGEKGQDGAPGKDGAPGPEGKQGPTGPKGEDADLWKPQISEDGNYLVFVNQKGEKSERFKIRGAKGDTGGEGPQGVQGPAGPVFIPSVNADGDLSWSNNGRSELKNPPTRNIKGDKGDKGDKGATFHPVVKDGVLYWYDDNGTCVNGISPVRITGAQGKQGEQGKPGLSAYEVWRKQGNYGTEQDFLDSLKGEKGTPAPPANFSFKDVEDYTCKVQKINTKLIVDSEEPTDSPEDIIRDRTEEIKKLREEGHKPENQKKNNVGWFKKFTWWCAGVDKDLLTMCPADHAKYVGVGTVILFTALMAWFSSFIAIRLVFDPIMILGKSIPLPAMAFATFWGAMIFFLDRFITNTMYSDGKVTISKQEFVSGLPRILIAIFLGIVISAPLELKIFASKINLEMDKQYEKELNEARTKAQEDATRKFNNELATKNVQLKQYTQSKSAIDARILQMNPPTPIQGERGTWIKNGQVVGGGSKITNQSDIDLWHKQNDSVKIKLQAESESYQKKISRIEREIEQADTARKAQEQEAVARAEERFKSKFDRKLSRQLSTLHDIAMEGYVPWFYKDKPDLDDISIDENSNTSAMNNSKDERNIYDSENFKIAVAKDSIPIDTSKNSEVQVSNSKEKKYLYGANNHKFAAAMDSILHAWWWYLFNSAQGLIMLLFILIDISPVLYKMMLADGNYDNYLHQEKLLAQDKIRLSLSNMLKKLNDSELQRVAPFIMGDIYDKMAGDSYVYKTEDEFKNEMSQHRGVCWFWRIWPFSLLRWLFYKEKEHPSAPVIIMKPKDLSKNQQAIINKNEALFEQVLDMKRKIIFASYQRWYKTQHDCIICDDVDDENKGSEPFEDDIKEDKDYNTTGGDSTSTNNKSQDESPKEDNPHSSDEKEEDNEEQNTGAGSTETSDSSTQDSSTQDSSDSDTTNEEDDERESPDDNGDDISDNERK